MNNCFLNMKGKKMKPVSETLELLQNFNEFKGTVQYFNSILKDYASKGFIGMTLLYLLIH